MGIGILGAATYNALRSPPTSASIARWSNHSEIRLRCAMPATVTLSSKNKVVIPLEARQKLGLGPGARLLVLVKEDRIVFMPEPANFVKRSSGQHKGLWSKGYLERERRGWRR